MKRIMLVLMLVCAVLTGLVGCDGRHDGVRESAQEIADAFANNDMNAINEMVFGTVGTEVDPELSDTSDKETQSKAGVLTSVFERVDIEVGDVTDSTIEYKVSAPDMSGLFDALGDDAEGITEEGLLDHVRAYAEEAKLKETAVTLGYRLVDGKPIVDYRDEAFVDAVTGGLLDAYENLYSKMLDEYAKGLE